MLTFVYYVTCKLMHYLIEQIYEYSGVGSSWSQIFWCLALLHFTVLSRNQRISMRVCVFVQQYVTAILLSC